MKPTECPLYPEMLNIQETSATLVKSIRRLRRKLNICKTCECLDNCQVMAQFSRDVQSAVQEISDEWNLGANFQ